MTEVITAPALGALTDDQLAEAWNTADVDDPAVFARFLAEFDQRAAAERMARARQARDAILAEGYDAAYAQYLQASDWCRGTLLSDLGKRKVTDEMSLWTGDEATALRYASEELRDFWMFVQPRITPGRYARQRGAQARAEREAARDRAIQPWEKGNDHEHDGDTAGTGLADLDPGPFRHEPSAEEAPRARPGRAVQRGGRTAGAGDGAGGVPGGRPGCPVQPGRVESGDEMTVNGEIAMARAIAAQRGCKHWAPGGKFGTADQCGDCPAAGGEAGPDPLEDEIRGPGEQQDDQEDTPGDLKFILGETSEFVARHVAATPSQVDAMTLYATATYALRAFPTFGRMLFTSTQEASGKTVAMMVTAALSANPLDASGTSYALQSALAAASNAPEQLTPTLYYDEISSVFGRSGLAASRDPIADILRKGYKAGATRAWSVNRTSEPYGVYTPFLMAGLRNAVPRDIRSRCIPLVMRPGTPERYFDAREAEPEAQALAACLAQAVASRIAGIAAFRARGIHPRLRDRHLEVWEPLFAVAYVLGGQEWLNRCLAAFRELALAESEQVTLSPRQQVLCDAARLLDGPLEDLAASGFVGGLALADEMRRLDNPLYASRSEAGLCKLIADAMPVPTTQKRVGGKPVRGYFAREIREAWAAVRPAEMEDAVIAEEENPFAVTDDTGGDSVDAGRTGVTGVTDNSGPGLTR